MAGQVTLANDAEPTFCCLLRNPITLQRSGRKPLPHIKRKPEARPEPGRWSQECAVSTLGYAAACFASAEEYLASSVRPDTACLILDVHMPGMSGVQLQARLLAEGDRTPIIFISAAADERIKKGVLEAGARGFVSKPIEEGFLVRLLGDAVTGFGKAEPIEDAAGHPG